MAKQYLIRLDDASEYCAPDRWQAVMDILNKYGVKAIIGAIPHNEDPELVRLGRMDRFWDTVKDWEKQGHTIALHGYNHVYATDGGGINPVNLRSEFADVPYETQCEKLRRGVAIMQAQGVNPKIFFAPAHTFDENTLKALLEATDIRIVSDMVAFDTFKYNGIYFIPQQIAGLRKTPFKVTTFCCHPNSLDASGLRSFEAGVADFLQGCSFSRFEDIRLREKKRTVRDKLYAKAIQFLRRRRRA